MSSARSANFVEQKVANARVGVRLHRFTVAEYRRMREFGVFGKDDPIELLDGRIYIKLDEGPPYGVPLGIPSEVIAGDDIEPYPQRRFTVDEYHRLMDSEAFHPELRTELVEGWVIDKMACNSRHDAVIQRSGEALKKQLGRTWELRIRMGLTMDSGEPEPDIAIVPGPIDAFYDAHPRPHHVELIVEMSDSTLAFDRSSKLRDYARNGVRCYWVVNMIARVIEAHLEPSGPTDEPSYASRRIFNRGESIPFSLGGKAQKSILVSELLGQI